MNTVKTGILPDALTAPSSVAGPGSLVVRASASPSPQPSCTQPSCSQPRRGPWG